MKRKNQWEIRYWELNAEIAKKSERNIFFGAGIICLFLLIGLSYCINGAFLDGPLDIDEDKICFELINNTFPEYNWQSARYEFNEGERFCLGTYDAKSKEIRNGLVLYNESVSETKTFKITDPEIIKLMADDDGNLVWVMLGFILGILIVFTIAIAIDLFEEAENKINKYKSLIKK